MTIRFLIAIVLAALAPAIADAAHTVVLPASTCPASPFFFSDGFDSGGAPRDASNGSGGAFPDALTRSVTVPGQGNRAYYLYVPANYSPATPAPMLIVLRGAVSPPDEATAAVQVRDDWASANAPAIIVSIVGTSTQGGWGAAGDFDQVNAVLADATAHYNIEQSRIYLWGFSAGAHFAHALALDNSDYFAAYAVSAGALQQYACTDSGSIPPTCAALLAGTEPKIPVTIYLGNQDPLYTNPQYGGAGDDPMRFESGGWRLDTDLFYTLFVGGHTYTRPQLATIWNTLCPFALAQ